MKRALIFSIGLISLDQILKLFFQFNFVNEKFLIAKNWGFTFVTNPGITLNYWISPMQIFAIQILQLFALVILYFGFKNIFEKTGNNFRLELAFAFFATALTGNVLLDRVFFGGIRDYFLTPAGVANFADACGFIGLILLSTDLLISRKKYLELVSE